MRGAEPFQLQGADGPGLPAGHRNMILEFGPRYRGKSYDDTTVMSIFHRTLNGGVSVLLERGYIRPLADWLVREPVPKYTAEPAQYTMTDGSPVPESGHGLYAAPFELAVRSSQNTAVLVHNLDRSVDVRIAWNGSGREKHIVLTPDQVADTAAWLDSIDRYGWTGWESGLRHG